jgi:hypothetical protein
MVTKFLIVIAMVVDIMAVLVYLCPALTAEQQQQGEEDTQTHPQ